MADTHYAWSPIRAGTADKPLNVKMGEAVTKDKLGVSQEDWDALVDAGSVRTLKVPDAVAKGEYTNSVQQYYRDEARKAMLDAGSSVDEANLAALHSVEEVS